MHEPQPTNPTPFSKMDLARQILCGYWGVTGADGALRVADLRSLELERDQVLELIDTLPPHGADGTTGHRVDVCYRVLERHVRSVHGTHALVPSSSWETGDLLAQIPRKSAAFLELRFFEKMLKIGVLNLSVSALGVLGIFAGVALVYWR